MEWKQIILWVSTFIIIVIFYRMTQQKYNGFFKTKEGLDTGSNSSAWTSDSSSSNGVDCSNSYTDTKSLPLREYFVKAAFNAGYDGNDVSTNAFAFRLAEGYRFIDLNVFCASGGNLYVGFSPDNSPTTISTSLPFETALQFIHQWGFTDNPNIVLPKPHLPSDTDLPGVPTLRQNCYSYPLFIHIRVYRPPNSKEDIISKVAKSINGFNFPQFYRDSNNKPMKVNGCTPLKAIMGKIVFTMDIGNIVQIYAPTNTPSAEYVPADTIQSLQSFVNMLTGGSTCLSFYDYTDPQIVAKTNTLRIADPNLPNQTNVKYMFIAFPSPDNSDNPDAVTMAKNNSIQYIPMRAYIPDSASGNLANYNKIFNALKVPFAPMSYVYTTTRSINNQSA